MTTMTSPYLSFLIKVDRPALASIVVKATSQQVLATAVGRFRHELVP
jgi:hypothetical protein